MDDDDEDQQGFDDAFDEKSDFCPRVVLPLSEQRDDLIVVVGESVVGESIINHLTKCGGMSSEFLSRHLVSFGGGKDTERERETKRTTHAGIITMKRAQNETKNFSRKQQWWW